MNALCFLCKKTWISALFVFVFSQVSWGIDGFDPIDFGDVFVEADAAATAENLPYGRLKRVAAIEILPYDPLADADDNYSLPTHVTEALISETQSIEEYHRDSSNPVGKLKAGERTRMRYGKELKPESYTDGIFTLATETGTYKDHFGFGRNCVYIDPDDKFLNEFKTVYVAPSDGIPATYDYKAETHGYYLKKLVEYEKTAPNEKRNLIFVRMRLENGSGESHDCFFGVFVSGRKLGSKFESKTPLSKVIPAPRELASEFKELSRSAKIKELEDFVDDQIKSVAEQLRKKFPNHVSGRGYSGYFHHHGGVLSIDKYCFSPYMQVDTRYDKDRLFFRLKLPKDSDKNPVEVFRVLGKRHNLLLKLFGDTIATSLLSGQVSSVPLDTDREQAHNFSIAHDRVFNQSEQAFLSFLDVVPDNYQDNCSLQIPPETVSFSASKISVYFYSTQDVCRYCRGGLAYMLKEGIIRTKIDTFFKRIYSKKKISTKILMTDDSLIKIFAFSNEETQT